MMKLLKSLFFSKFCAKWIYRRGMLRAKLRKNQLAIVDYTTVIEMAEVPAGIRAMALYNRALVYHATSFELEAVSDLHKVLEMTGATGQVKTEARRKLVRLNRTFNQADSREPNSTSRSQGGTRARIEMITAGKHNERCSL